MRYIFFTIISFALLNTAYSQNFVRHDSAIVSVSGGYAIMNAGGVNDYYHDLMKQYHENGVPIPVQNDFGNTVIVNGEFLYSFTYPAIWLGITAGYSYTPAYSGYKDITGTLKVKGSIDCYDIAFATKFSVAEIANLPICFNFRIGESHYSCDITETAEFIDYPQGNYSAKTSLSFWAPYFETTVEALIKFSPVILSLETGYRITILGDKEFSYQFNHEKPYQVGIETSNLYGFVFLIGAEYAL